MNEYFVSQRYHNDCGIACCAMILNYYNREYKYNDLLKRIKTNEYATLKDLKDIFGGKRLFSYAYKCELGSLKDIHEFPVIIQIIMHNRAHFIVLFDFCDKNSSLIVGDPLKWHCVSRRITYIEKYWSGYLMRIHGEKGHHIHKHVYYLP